jgi:hypothetical protein
VLLPSRVGHRRRPIRHAAAFAALPSGATAARVGDPDVAWLVDGAFLLRCGRSPATSASRGTLRVSASKC